LIIAIDFDGTCVKHEYPEIGQDIGAIPVLKDLIEEGHQLVLFTMRGGMCLVKAVQWFNDNGIDLYGVNTNPTQAEWTDSPKVYAHIYIDDAALGVPLLNVRDFIGDTAESRPYVDWSEVRKILTNSGVL
jgi:hypothetical protein